MLSLKASGVITFIGSVLFLVAAFAPISGVYALPTAEDKLKMINGALSAWRFSQAAFSAGAIITALGAALAAIVLRGRPAAPLLFTAAACLAIGAVAWTWHVVLRANDPAAFASGSLPGWHFMLYTLLTMVGLIMVGAAFLQLGFPAWSGWMLIGGSVLFLALYVIFKDMPPFVHYLLGLVMAFTLFRAG